MPVEETIAQLEAIIERRNILLRQMYRMLRRRGNVVSILEAEDSDDDDDDDSMIEFLERYKLNKEDPDAGSIALLDEDLLRPSESVPSDTEDQQPQHSIAETLTSSFSNLPSPLDVSPASSMSPESDTKAEGDSLPLPPPNDASRESSPLSEKEESDNVAEALQELVSDALTAKDVEMEDIDQPEPVQDSKVVVPEPTNMEPTAATPAVIRNDVMLSEADSETRTNGPPSPPKRPTVILNGNFNGSINPKFVFRAPTPPVEIKIELEEPKTEGQPRLESAHYEYREKYTLPPPGYATMYAAKKSKSSKQKRRDRGDGRRDCDSGPQGYFKWAAHMQINPVWKRVGRAQKCLNSREWAIASHELRLTRVIERIERLKNDAKWALRQPKKQKNLGGTTKSHWDHLMDEMKWMRIDFREERKFKLALAYELSTAVLEWHAAGGKQERIDKGICVLWKPLTEPTIEEAQLIDQGSDAAILLNDQLQEPLRDSQAEYPNEEESDDDAVAEPESDYAMLADVAPSSSQVPSSPGKALIKTEDTTVQASLEALEGGQRDGLQLNEESKTEEKLQIDQFPPALATSNDRETIRASPTKPSSKSSYSTLRTVLAYSDANALFFDPFSIDKSDDAPDISDLSNLTAIFPEFIMYNLLDTTIPQPPPSQDGKKKSERKYEKDDPYRRAEEMTYMKLYPAVAFMQSRITLLGPLKPAKNWNDGRWLPLQEGPSLTEIENPSKITEDSTNELFEPRPNHSPLAVLAMQLQAYSARQDKEIKRRPSMHHWTPGEDTLLKQLIDKYQINWVLIAETFNSSRPTISTDIRTPRDCMERWREKWMPGRVPEPASAANAVEDTSNQITTRGVKRQAAASIAAPSPGASEAMGQESRKRRRHAYLQEAMRKASKKRAEIIARQQANQRKPPQIHETHAQYAKLPRRTPAELSRMKAEKEAQDIQEMQQLARRRQEELHRATLSHFAASGQTDAQGQKAQAPPTSSVQRPAAGGQFVPQIRGMAQQPQQSRTGTALAGASRLSPQQILQAQVAQATSQQIQQSRGQQPTGAPQAQSVAQPTPQGPNVPANGVAQANVPHLSPPFAARDSTASPVHSSAQHVLNAQISNSPRPPSAQAVPLQQPQMQVNTGTRIGYYMPTIPGYTTEQIQHALRMQQQHQNQQTQGSINYQAASNNPI